MSSRSSSAPRTWACSSQPSSGGRGDYGTTVAAGIRSARHPDRPRPLPEIILAVEHYNRIVRIIDEYREPATMEVEVRAEFYDKDLRGYNVVAEIPGTDKRDEIVMLGGHIDSWSPGTGAADNAAGVAVSMEAVRILNAIGARPRRTIRVVLWGAEEKGWVGSKLYVANHFADVETMTLKPEHAKVSAYFNYDNGTGRIRGVYLQQNVQAAPIFEAWMKPFADLGMTQLSPRSTMGSDHGALDLAGIPAFQWIQDPIDYSTRVHHSNLDVFDHLVPEDLVQVVLGQPTCRRCAKTAVALSIGWLDVCPFSHGATPRVRRGHSRTEARVNAFVKTIPLVLLATASVASAQTKDPVDYVDTRIGTISHMLVPTFPTIQRPNGMLRIVPPNESFTTDRINGFNLSVPSHRQGAVFRLMPATGDAAALGAEWSSRFDHSTALPYRYSVFLDDHDATVAFAPGRRAAICAVDFERAPAGDQERFVMLRPQRKGSLRIEGRVITGTDDYHGVTVYLHGELDPAPARAGAFAAGVLDFASRATRDSAEPVVAAFPAAVGRVRLRYAISYVSADQARRNLEAEIRDFDLERLAAEARAEWNAALGKVSVEGGTEDEKTVFYTALYRSHERMVPISEDGRYFSAWDGKVHDDGGVPFWTDDWIWDTFHALHPLNVLLNPRVESEKIASVHPRLRTIGLDADVSHGVRRRALHERATRGGAAGGRVAQGHPGLRPRARVRVHEENHARGESHPVVSRAGDRTRPLLLGERLLPRAPSRRAGDREGGHAGREAASRRGHARGRLRRLVPGPDRPRARPRAGRAALPRTVARLPQSLEGRHRLLPPEGS